MSNFRKHTDVVANMDEFNENYNNGMYISPWVVYVGDDVNGYKVIYSNDENEIAGSIVPDVIESLNQRIRALEDEKVFCHEDEYNELIEKGVAWVTNVDGTRSEAVYDSNKLYCIYEDDGPVSDTDGPESSS